MAVTRDKPAPYAPASAILELIKRHRDRGLPSPVTGEVLGRAGISQSLISRTLQALQTLDLIDENGAPTPVFEGIRLAPESECKQRLEEWLRLAYADAFAFVDPSQDDEIRIRDAFRHYQPNAQQNRMVTLFQGLCGAAGLMPDKPASTRAPRPRQAQPRAASHQPIRPTAGANSSTVKKNGHSLPPALSGLMESLPVSDGWTTAERQRFLATFQAVLDYCIPIIEKEQQIRETAA